MAQQEPTWLVTGAAGFLGANLGRHLEGRARRVGLARATSIQKHYDEVITADLANLADTERAAQQIERMRPDVIVHAAAMATHEGCEADPEQAERVNATSAAILARAAANAGSRLILISTDAVFDGTRGHYTEQDEPHPFSTYGRTKLHGEQQALAANPEALVVGTNFFGWSPSGARSILEFFVTNLRKRNPVKGFTDFMMTSAYVATLCEVLEDLARADVNGILHVTSPDALSKYEFGVAVAEEFGLDADLITPTAADVDPPRNRDRSLDVSAVQAILSRRLLSQRAGIVRARSEAVLLTSSVGDMTHDKEWE